jgi:hypothetical protein
MYFKKIAVLSTLCVVSACGEPAYAGKLTAPAPHVAKEPVPTAVEQKELVRLAKICVPTVDTQLAEMAKRVTPTGYVVELPDGSTIRVNREQCRLTLINECVLQGAIHDPILKRIIPQVKNAPAQGESVT